MGTKDSKIWKTPEQKVFDAPSRPLLQTPIAPTRSPPTSLSTSDATWHLVRTADSCFLLITYLKNKVPNIKGERAMRFVWMDERMTQASRRMQSETAACGAGWTASMTWRYSHCRSQSAILLKLRRRRACWRPKIAKWSKNGPIEISAPLSWSWKTCIWVHLCFGQWLNDVLFTKLVGKARGKEKSLVLFCKVAERLERAAMSKLCSLSYAEKQAACLLEHLNEHLRKYLCRQALVVQDRGHKRL